MTGKGVVEIVYRWPDGKEEVRYRRLVHSQEAQRLMNEVDEIKNRLGRECPYFYRTDEGAK